MECNFWKIKYIRYNADQIKFVSKSKTIGIKWYTISYEACFYILIKKMQTHFFVWFW